MTNDSAIKPLFHDLVDRVQPEELEELLFQLIRIESHQETPGWEANLVAFIKEYLEREKIDVELQAVLAERENLIARIRGNGTGPVLVFNGHTDTVPPYEMEDPFLPRKKNGRIYGRGSVDMKGALAAMIGVLLALKRGGVQLEGDVVFAATIGEESYSPGAYHLVTSGFHADYAIVGEPTGMKVGIAHKGVIWGEAIFHGRSVHGSVPEKGINAIYKASDWIAEIQRSYIPALKERCHPLLGHPTINIGMIEGGTRPVIVPQQCTVRFERRLIPGETEEAALGELQGILDELAKKDPDMSGEVRALPVFHGVPHGPLESQADSDLVKALRTAYREEFRRDAEPCGLQYWTDGALLAMIPGVQTVVCGPGDIAQAHSNEEYITCEQLHAAYRIYLRTALSLCTTFNEGAR
ncbi:ArgE/DapE family deacylase [Bacillaceae bacterium]